eukprot:Seg1384.3 transcript_id=Seg1384.3/GoldUCD/mRNA.D3Y31 product="hypothetical protein" protein_id=Seg1384.3/GoldUCD/D3Y31
MEVCCTQESSNSTTSANRDSQSTVTLTSPSQNYWSSSEDTLCEPEIPASHVETACQTNDVVVMDKEQYEDLLQKAMTVSINMPEEVARITKKCFELFGTTSQPVLDPKEFEKICFDAGSKLLFDTICMSITSERQSDERKHLNRVRTVVVIYILMYGLSQRNNWFQATLARALGEYGISDQALTALKNLGMAAHSKTIQSASKSSSESHLSSVASFFEHAYTAKKFLVMYIDDFHNIHTWQTPKDENQTQAVHMATLLVKVFPNKAAVEQSEVNLHDDEPASSTKLNDVLFKLKQGLSQSYAEVMPDWVTVKYFRADAERQRLLIHDYQHTEIREMRSMTNCKLVDCLEIPLKSYSSFLKALKYMLDNGLFLYLSEFVVPFLGDWPAQFYLRQMVYDPANSAMVEVKNIIPFLGPLHISLNSRQCVVLTFHGIFQDLYSFLFGKKANLTKKPQAWRISLLLKMLYGGWTLLREEIMSIFAHSKDIEFMTLFNLLDNYCPLVLSIYSVVFKSNNCEQYYESVFRCWVMMMVFLRRHYNKALLIATSVYEHLKSVDHPILERLYDSLVGLDEYPVENFHSSLRARTRKTDTAEQIMMKALELDACKKELQSFKSWFTPARKVSFSPRTIGKLKSKAAGFIMQKFKLILEILAKLKSIRNKGYKEWKNVK